MKVSINDDIIISEIDDEAVLLHLKDELYFGLDAIGLHFYNSLKECADPKICAKELSEFYSVDESEIAKDLLVLIKDLEQANIVTIER